MICLKSLILFLFICANSQAKTIKKASANLVHNGLWAGKWFPHAPGEPDINANKADDTLVHNGQWTGKWFPNAPDESQLIANEAEPEQRVSCDDAKHGIAIDYDVHDRQKNFHYLCLSSNRRVFAPNSKLEALQKNYYIPPAYVPPVLCLNESITYEQELPTFGSIRPLAPVYGSYMYVPPQRYLRNLAEGAIVVLYHPCAEHRQIANLLKWVRACLYRHIITPTQALSADRPLALLAWGKSLEMSVPEARLVTDFIKQHAKKGPMVELYPNKLQLSSYNEGLLKEAHLVSDLMDSELCGFYDM